MSNIDKQALRLAAKNATQGNWKFARSGFNAVVQSPAVLQRGGNSLVVICKLFRAEWRGELRTSQDAAFIAAANPITVLALLDELEAANNLNAELSELNKHFDLALRKSDGVNEALRRHIIELESRTVTVKLPSLKQTESGERYVWADGVYNYRCDVIEVLTAAGIALQEGE